MQPLGWVNRIIVLLILMTAAVWPVCGQEAKTDSKPDAVQTTTEPGSGQGTGSRFALSAGETPAVPVKRLRGDDDQATGSRFALSAGETPAVPVNRLRGDDDQATGSRFALSAGETPPVPVKRLTRYTRTDAGQGSVSAFALPIKHSTNQATSDPYVFPTRKERFDRYVKSMFGPSALLRAAVTAGINQWEDSPEEWEQGASGYGKRFASSFGRNAVQQTVVYGLDSALGLDTGFRRSPSKKFGARLMHALAENITSRTKSGKRVISVPRITGAYTSGVISREAWYPERYNYKDGLRSGTNSLLIGFALNVVREFVFKF